MGYPGREAREGSRYVPFGVGGGRRYLKCLIP